MVEKKSGEDIYGLMGKILVEVEDIQKSRRNEQQGYSFRGIDEVYSAIHPVFAKYGVFVLPRVLEKDSSERTTDRGTILRFTELKVAYDFCAPDGSKVTAEVVGEAMDSGDKSSNKAMSAAQKYAILQTFCIPTGDQPDADASTPDEVRPTRSCPQCGKSKAVIKGKAEYGGGWLCFKKKGGCGATWQDADDSPGTPPAASLDDAAMNALRQNIKAAMQALNDAGDVPEWTVQRVNEMSKLHFGDVAARLDLDKLGQLAEMFSQRLEAIRKDAAGIPKKEDVIASIQASAQDGEIESYLKEHHAGAALDSLNLEELDGMDKAIGIPF